MTHDVLIFDMDGTLCDSRQGITRGFNYALQQCGYEPREDSEILRYIGPPLHISFAELTGQDEPHKIDEIITRYREYYTDQGIHELTLYEGISAALNELHGQIRLGVCTSKRRDFARRIVLNLSMDRYFDFVSGSSPGLEKWQQLGQLKKAGTISEASVMIGDRHHDISAARANGLTSIGVLWGYGNEEELREAGADFIISHPSELTDWLKGRQSS